MKKRGLTILQLILFLCLLSVPAAIVVPGFLKARVQEKLTNCKSNCKELAIALEAYATCNQGRYPGRLGSLTAGGYLKTIPTCPTAKADTYSPSYQVQSNPDGFSFCCTGNNHGRSYRAFTGNSSGFPQYNSIDGLVDHP